MSDIRDKIRQRFRKGRPVVVGASPMAIFVPPDAETTKVLTHVYGASTYSVQEGFASTESAGALRWIDIVGLADKNVITSVTRTLGLGDLATAELFHTDQRAHTEILGEMVQTFMRLPVSSEPFRSDQVSLVLGPGFVLSVRERDTGAFDPVRRRLESGPGRIRSASGYLFFALTDTILDLWFPLLESYGDEMEALEEKILSRAEDNTVAEVHRLKRDLLDIRRAVWPLRDAISVLLRDDTPGIEEWMQPFFRDCADHAFQALDMVEVYREIAQGLVDLHLSSLSNKMNEIMKVLAIIATIFIPMTFIAGFYGMNFDRSSPWNMPELGWRYGYAYALALMAGSAGIMIYVFYRLGWVGRNRTTKRKAQPLPDRDKKTELSDGLMDGRVKGHFPVPNDVPSKD